MKFQLYPILLCALIVSSSSNAGDSDSTTFYLIRHAEKVHDESKDPVLTDFGRQRAAGWATIMSSVKLDFVYSTDTTRTRDTATPIADQQGLSVTLYSPRDFNYQAFTEKHRGHSVLITGHSNTTPAFVNGLILEEKYPELDESVYGNLYIVDFLGAATNSKILTIHPLSE